MPGLSGLDVLQWIRRQPGLRTLRVVILTSSDDMRDMRAAYQAGANSFLVKPVDFERLVEISRALSGYWLWLDRGPEVERPPAGSMSDTELIRRVGGVSVTVEGDPGAFEAEGGTTPASPAAPV
jgi:response regulator RpfG family c-di-GMP phosphodiesterase